MSIYETEGSTGSTPEELQQRREELADDRYTSSGGHAPAEPVDAADGSSEGVVVNRQRPRYVRPALRDFTGISEVRPAIGDTSFAEGARQRGLDALRALRAQLPGSSESVTSIGLRAAQHGEPGTSSPEQLRDRGRVTEYTDSFGFDVTTLSDPRDPRQRYDPTK